MQNLENITCPDAPSWEQTTAWIDALVGQMHADGFMPDCIGAVPRGGWPVAALSEGYGLMDKMGC